MISTSSNVSCMKIAILTLGTRGDVQPFAVLGNALQKRGHDVTLCTARNFKTLANTYGLHFVSVDIDFQELIESDEAKKIMKNPFMMKKYLRNTIFPKMSDAFQIFYQLAEQNDKVLFHIKTLADYFADAFPGKMIRADVIPTGEATKAFPNPIFSALRLPAFMNRLTYQLTELGLKMWKKPILDIQQRAGLVPHFRRPVLPAIYGISEHILPKPADYPVNSFFTGFWVALPEGQLDEDIMQFLEAGTPPLLITFGSMPFQTKVSITALIKTLLSTQQIRIIVVKGWGLSDTKEIEALDNVKVISAAPYDLLFPYVKAVVHHGGVGTTAACLRAGKPMLICPVLYPFGDQHFWGTIIQKKGCGIKPVPLKRVTEKIFAEKVGELLHNTALYEAAEKIGKLLRAEDGLEKAISIIEDTSIYQIQKKPDVR